MKPNHCMHSIEGPPIRKGSPIVSWRRFCKNKAKRGESYCGMHIKLHRPRTTPKPANISTGPSADQVDWIMTTLSP